MAPPAAPDLTGSRIGEYDVVSRLGGGGMGVVYEGRGADGKRFAIKTLKAALSNDQELVSRFEAEARALKGLSHRALVEIVSIGQLADGTHYFVMEFLEGRSFEEVIEHGAPLDPGEVLAWMCEVLDALEVVHQAGVIHRDLKPSNLFLARTAVGPQVKLIDFGVAKHAARSGPNTLVSAIVGTPDYMSPEQVSGSKVTAASDLYALGCVMFEMLTGELPFSDESSVRKMMMHIEQPAPRVSSVVQSIPPGLDDIVAWTLEKDPEKRPPSARALKARIDALSDAIGGKGPAATMQIRAVQDPSAPRLSPPAVTQPGLPRLEEPLTDPAAGLQQPVRIRRRTEPVPKPTVWRFQRWMLLFPVALLVGVALPLLVWRMVRTPPEQTMVAPPPPPPPPVPLGDQPPSIASDDKAPPDRPTPKRKKPQLPPTRKKPGKHR